MPLFGGGGSGGVKSAGISQSVRETRDLSQVVRRTLRDTPVPLYTRTSPWPNNLCVAQILREVAARASSR